MPHLSFFNLAAIFRKNASSDIHFLECYRTSVRTYYFFAKSWVWWYYHNVWWAF